jgi:hypothetical protein
MKWRIRNFIKGVKNLVRWFSVIWKDRDWDYYYILEIYKTKLKFQSEHFRKYGYHVDSKRDAERMELCIRLMERVQCEYYMDELLNEDLTHEMVEKAISKNDKARRLLFKLLEQNIERWWT